MFHFALHFGTTIIIIQTTAFSSSAETTLLTHFEARKCLPLENLGQRKLHTQCRADYNAKPFAVGDMGVTQREEACGDGMGNLIPSCVALPNYLTNFAKGGANQMMAVFCLHILPPISCLLCDRKRKIKYEEKTTRRKSEWM